MSEATKTMNYDPNLVSGFNMAKQDVRLTFGLWDYRKEVVVSVTSNIQGLEVINLAVENLHESMIQDDETLAPITLVNAEGDELECEDDEGREEDWLKHMLVGAEILSIVAVKE